MKASLLLRSTRVAAVHAAALFFLAGCGGNGEGEESLFLRFEPAKGNRLFVHGEEIQPGAAIEAIGGTLRIGGRLFDPAAVAKEIPLGAADAERLYGAVPSVRDEATSGIPIDEAAERFRERERGIRASAVRAWRGATEGGASPDEAAAATLASIGEEDRSLFDGKPIVSSGGLISIRFLGRPPELWILRAPPDGERFAPASARDFALRVIRFLGGDPPRTVLLGDRALFLKGEEAIRSAAGESGR